MTAVSTTDSEALFKNLSDNPSSPTSLELVADSTLCLAKHWQSALKKKYMEGVGDAPDWLEYEMRIWELGETLRSICKSQRWKGTNPLMDAAAHILAKKQYGKGRQSFALLLGDFGGIDYAEPLVKGLYDIEVQGHCIKAMNKAKISGYAPQVEELLENSSGWIKSAAKRYLDRLGDLA